MMNAEKDLKPRTKEFARRVIRLFAALSKDTAAQVLGKQLLREANELVAIFVTISKRARGD